MTDSLDQPREIQRGHLRQVRARLEDDHVRVERQKRTHRFGEGTSDRGPAIPIWSGSLDEATELYEALDALLFDEE